MFRHRSSDIRGRIRFMPTTGGNPDAPSETGCSNSRSSFGTGSGILSSAGLPADATGILGRGNDAMTDAGYDLSARLSMKHAVSILITAGLICGVVVQTQPGSRDRSSLLRGAVDGGR